MWGARAFGIGLMSLFFIIASESRAIPPFSRRYSTSCSTCHAPLPPKLNHFGQAFKDRGFRMPGDDALYLSAPDVELGAEAWKVRWPDAIWPGAIPDTLPMGLRVILEARLAPAGPAGEAEEEHAHEAPALLADEPGHEAGEEPSHLDEESGGEEGHQEAEEQPDHLNNEPGEEHAKEATVPRKLRLIVPREVEFLVGGTAGAHVSYWSVVEFGPEDVELHAVYGQLDNLFDSTLLNLRVGKFQLRLPAFNSHQVYTATPYYVATVAPEYGGAKRFAIGGAKSAIELWGVRSVATTGGGLRYSLGMVNTSGTEATALKDFYGRVAYKFGGIGTGASLEEITGELKPTGNWIDDSVTLGAFGYRGFWGDQEEPFLRLGADLDLWYRTLNLYGIVLYGQDDLHEESDDLKFTAWSVGADWIVFPWAILTARYEGARFQAVGDEPERTVQRVVPGVRLGLRANAAFNLEAVLFLEERSEENYGLARFDIAF
ncbi:MAG: hypothetical protein KatS3mg115_1042 [Candidatus Poribacteria bacterium]|nr:MAG: hypothetical protein KatS3mg115_1042 [Candidatus Poribacteria bacterium]